MKRLMIGVNGLLMAVLCAANYVYLSPGGGISKAFCSGCFALLGVLNAGYVFWSGGKRAFAAAMASGLLLAMAGDLRIGPSFVQGAVLFAAGHVGYLVAYHLLIRPERKDWLWGLAVFVPCAVYLLFSQRLVFHPAWFQWVCLGYALVISLMTGKALSSFLRERSCLTALLLAGSVLFFFSDLMLLLQRFGGFGKLFGTLCMAAYYPAQLLLAHAVFYSGRRSVTP